MEQPLLSILIPTTPDRISNVAELVGKIQDQCNSKEIIGLNGMVKVSPYECISYGLNEAGTVEIIIYDDNKIITLGEKRERLYRFANAKASWQLDSDDSIADNAIELILEAIKENPEIPCITFREKCMVNGIYKSSNHSIKYSKWQDNFDGYDYVRCAFYKDVIRTDIAQSVPFPKIRWNEDEQWSMDVKPLLTYEIHIDEELYYYIYEPKDTHEQRYGFDKEKM